MSHSFYFQKQTHSLPFQTLKSHFLCPRFKLARKKKIPKPTSPHKMLKILLQPFNTLLVVLLLLMTMRSGMSVLDLNSVKTSELDVMVKRACAGKISDCPAVSVEEEMDSESNKRMLLMQRRFISYETLKRDFAPCDRPGASYYNCKASGPVNTYNRGCEIITRCDRGG